MNQSLLDLALEYLNDLKSSGIEDEQRMRNAVERYLALDEEELKEVWERWKSRNGVRCADR